MKSIYNITLENLEKILVENGYKKFNASQIYDWLYKKRVKSFDEMLNIKNALKEFLKENYTLNTIKLIDKQIDIDVCKYLFELNCENKIEAVYMKHNYGHSLCISTQVGCNMSCAFCESGRLKKVRNLESFEMVEQILKIEEDLNLRLTHLVLMGIGEPFDNYDNVINFIDIINNPKGIELGSRHITISTCGLVPKIEEFMNYDKQVNLAISLHAPNNEIRNKIMPINKAYPVEVLIEAINKYINKTNRRVTFEYIMLKGINDSEKCALELSKLLKGINCYVNLIPYNETSHIDLQKSSKEQILKFYDILKKNKINVTIRKEFGSKVSAACGQLRSIHEEGK
ncbi:MAG: 23S rRNA (adenine(2503)-C(2))-methyltransferase RlmN [Firmicutes bacterium]|nr:23S rRNA (adenine(2503)-C(2))-methyltransferase RlmN [Bacillota bacterium]